MKYTLTATIRKDSAGDYVVRPRVNGKRYPTWDAFEATRAGAVAHAAYLKSVSQATLTGWIAATEAGTSPISPVVGSHFFAR